MAQNHPDELKAMFADLMEKVKKLKSPIDDMLEEAFSDWAHPIKGAKKNDKQEGR